MIERNIPFENYTALCDLCANDQFYDCWDFAEVISSMRKDGWGIRNNGNGWTHVCPVCVEKGKS